MTNWILDIVRAIFSIKEPAKTINTPAPVAVPSEPKRAPQISSSHPSGLTSPPQLHGPLLRALEQFEILILPKGTRLFHGCNELSEFTDHAAAQLHGSRKWLSQDAEYAVSYAYYCGNKKPSDGFLWVCEVTEDIACLVGKQFSLRSLGPWGSSFPESFPNNFKSYADAILGGNGPKALLDHETDGKYREVLVSPPSPVLKVLEVITLPPDKHAAEQLARERFGARD